jgi:sulfur carrier protein
VNGQIRILTETADALSLASVLMTLAVRKELVAIALNDTIIPKGRWEETTVSRGDKLEIVHFVGGGCFDVTQCTEADWANTKHT